MVNTVLDVAGNFHIRTIDQLKERYVTSVAKIGHFAQLYKSAKPPDKPNGVRPQQR